MTQAQAERRSTRGDDPPESTELTGPKKVAALLLSMDKQVASRILKHFDEDDIKLIAQTATDLGAVSKETLDALIEEFAQHLRTGGDLIATAHEVEQLLNGVVPPEQIAEIMQQVRSKSLQSIWIKLGEVPELSTAQYLTKEHPQVSALVLSRTPPAYAAAALKMLPGPLRNEDRIEMLRQYLANNGRGRKEVEQAASRVFRAAAKQLRTARSKGRFMMVVDCFDPHEPWIPPRRYMDMYGDPDYRGYEIATVAYTHASNYLRPRHIARLQTTYKAAVTMTDHWLGYFLDRLWQLGLDDSTTIALVSDHGVFVGERDWTGKGPRRLYPELIHVPLIVREPGGLGAGQTSDWFASTHDVAPTLVSLGGVRRPKAFEGADLTPILEGRLPEEDRRYAVGGYGNNTYVRDDRWAYQTQNDWSDERLYDLAADPGERVDVSAKRPGVVREMRRRVLAAAGGKRPPVYSDAHMDGRKRTSWR